MPYQSNADGFTSFAVTKNPPSDGLFATSGPGWSLLRYQFGSPAGQSAVFFKVVRSVWHDNTTFFPSETHTAALADRRRGDGSEPHAEPAV